jgi:hypothetical protein
MTSISLSILFPVIKCEVHHTIYVAEKMHKKLVFYFRKICFFLLKFDDIFQSLPQKVYFFNEYM